MKPLPRILLFLCGSLGLFAAAAHAQNDDRGLAAPSPSEWLLPELTRQVSQYFHTTGELQLELQRPWTAPIPAGTNIDVFISEYPTVLTSTLLLRVRVQPIGLPPIEQTLTVHAQLLREAWSARSPLERGTAFDPGQLEVRRVDALREHDVVFTTDGDSNFVFSRSISAGRVVTWHDLTRRSLVRRGDIIEVAAVDGSLTITMKAMAMENGAAGDSIKVRNLDSKKEFPAQVVGEARAQVRF